jgi:diguanylate cyclase (GGDEF)-like protein
MDLNNKDTEKFFISNPNIMKHYGFLQEIGVFSYIDSLARNIYNYKTMLSRGLEIFNRTSIDEIMDATVEQISYHFLPDYVAFLWKPIQSRPDITIRAYRNYKPFDLNLKVENISPFETYFQNYPKPVSFEDLIDDMKSEAAALTPYKEVYPEIIIPILGPLGLYGIILVGRKTEKGQYSQDEIEFFHYLMSFVSQAIKNNLHYEHSLRDVKTGLYNHGFFMARMKEEINQVQRSSFTSSVIVIDVDKFKNFNDTYGHLAGDQVLEKLAQVIKQNVRGNDIPSRFGGEEFTVLLPRTDINVAWAVAERLRNSVAVMQVPWEVPLPQVTISLGVFTFDQNSNLETTDILRRADEALYASKARGRNRSTLWEPGLFVDAPIQAIRNY